MRSEPATETLVLPRVAIAMRVLSIHEQGSQTDRKDLSSSGGADPPDDDCFQRWLSCIDLLDCPVAVADDVNALGGYVGLDALKGVGSLNSLIFVHVRVVIVFYKLYG